MKSFLSNLAVATATMAANDKNYTEIHGKKTWFISFIKLKNLENGLSLPTVITPCSDFKYNKENVLSSHSLEYGIVVENVDKGDSGKGARFII